MALTAGQLQGIKLFFSTVKLGASLFSWAKQKKYNKQSQKLEQESLELKKKSDLIKFDQSQVDLKNRERIQRKALVAAAAGSGIIPEGRGTSTGALLKSSNKALEMDITRLQGGRDRLLRSYDLQFQSSRQAYKKAASELTFNMFGTALDIVGDLDFEKMNKAWGTPTKKKQR
jgi:hypothetical protein